jgi:hypothetical protein
VTRTAQVEVSSGGVCAPAGNQVVLQQALHVGPHRHQLGALGRAPRHEHDAPRAHVLVQRGHGQPRHARGPHARASQPFSVQLNVSNHSLTHSLTHSRAHALTRSRSPPSLTVI